MHIHLVAFQVVNRQPIDVDGYTATWEAYLTSGRKARLKPALADYLARRTIQPAPEEMGYKDTVKAYPGYVTRVRAKFTLPWTSRWTTTRRPGATAPGSITATSSSTKRTT